MNDKDKLDFLKQYRELTDGKVLSDNEHITNLLKPFNVMLLEGYHDFLGNIAYARCDN